MAYIDDILMVEFTDDAIIQKLTITVQYFKPLVR